MQVHLYLRFLVLQAMIRLTTMHGMQKSMVVLVTITLQIMDVLQASMVVLETIQFMQWINQKISMRVSSVEKVATTFITSWIIL